MRRKLPGTIALGLTLVVVVVVVVSVGSERDFDEYDAISLVFVCAF